MTSEHREATYDILVVGDLITDLVMPIPRLPVCANAHQMSHGLFVELGGACNFLVAAVRLGLRAKALGPVGDDFYGHRVVELLRQSGVDVTDVTVEPGTRSTLALVLVDDAGDHVFLGVQGSRLSIPPLARWEARLLQARAVYVNGYVGLEDATPQNLVDVFQSAQRVGVLTFFDPGPEISHMDEGWLAAMLAHTFCLQLTLDEATALVGDAEVEEVARRLMERGPEMVALKLGEEGCLMATREQQVRDTTGAGDAFDAGCVYGYLAGYPLEHIGLIANAVGAATTMVVGAGTRIPDRAVVERLLRREGLQLKEVMPIGPTGSS